MSSSTCRWGILSTADIARKNWKAIWHAENATLAAVASRTPERAADFIRSCQSHLPFPNAPQAFGSYEELLASPEVDAVYIPLPTALRTRWVLEAARAGKHVLVEKPVGTDTAEVRKIIDTCREHHVQFMDGVMFMHSRRLEAVRQALEQPDEIGNLRRIGIHFSFCGDEAFLKHNIRTQSHLEPMGCLGDLGWYCVRIILWTLKWQMPTRVHARLITPHSGEGSPEPVPAELSAELFFSNGVSASFYCSFLTENQEWVVISGTRGFIRIPDFVLPFFGSELSFDITRAAFRVSGCDFNMENHTRTIAVPEHANSHPSAQETNMIRHFSGLVTSGRREANWGEFSLKTQSVLDAVFESARNDARAVTPAP